MAAAEVVLEYKRESGDRSTGKIYYREAALHPQTLVEFQEEAFDKMIHSYATALQQYPEAIAVWQRTDRDGLLPYYLDSGVVALLRTDPEAAIEGLSPKPQSPSAAVRRVREARKPEILSIRAGYDTLADAFGEELYTRQREGKLECPGCGIWSAHAAGLFCCGNPSCVFYGGQHHIQSVTPKWAALSTQELINACSPRYYFPRVWNNRKPWIKHVELVAKYEEYKKEKESCR